MAWSKMSVPQIIEELKKECNHYANGSCQTRACMKWVDHKATSGPCDEIVEPYEFVGCLEYQAIAALSAEDLES